MRTLSIGTLESRPESSALGVRRSHFSLDLCLLSFSCLPAADFCTLQFRWRSRQVSVDSAERPHYPQSSFVVYCSSVFFTPLRLFSFLRSVVHKFSITLLAQQEEGVWRLWRGNVTNIVRVVPYSATQFASYDFFKVCLCNSALCNCATLFVSRMRLSMFSHYSLLFCCVAGPGFAATEPGRNEPAIQHGASLDCRRSRW